MKIFEKKSYANKHFVDKMGFAALCSKHVFSFFFANSILGFSILDIKSMSIFDFSILEFEKKCEKTNLLHFCKELCMTKFSPLCRVCSSVVLRFFFTNMKHDFLLLNEKHVVIM